VFAIVNQKGGVGKTTTAVNLGAALTERGLRVLLVDMDAQGNATTGLGVDRSRLERCVYSVVTGSCQAGDAIVPTGVEGLDLLPARMDLAAAEVELAAALARENRLRNALAPVKRDYAYVLVDSAPSLGLLTVNSLVAGEQVLIPIQCEYYALEGLSQLLQIVELVRANLNAGLAVAGVLLTMSDKRLRLAGDVEQEVRGHFGDKAYRTVIPRSVRLSEAPSYGKPITQYAPDSKGAEAYRKLAQEVVERGESWAR